MRSTPAWTGCWRRRAGDPGAEAAPLHMICDDHACDGCGYCRRGFCCGRDRPGHRAPGLGEWDGPVYGELGVLVSQGDEVQCHACGHWYRNVGNHAWWTHGLTAAEYRAMFGLRAQTGLVGPWLREFQRQNARRHLRAYWPVAAERLRSQPPEQRSARNRGRKRALEASLDAANRAAWLDNSRRGGQRIRELWLTGARQRPQPRRTGWEKARARWCELVQDPAYRAGLSRRLSETRSGRVEIACATCGQAFRIPPHLARGDHRRFCSTACVRQFQRQRGLERGREMGARSHRPASMLCQECGAAFLGSGRRRYCSRRCKVQARAHRTTDDCPWCGRSFSGRTQQRYCSRPCAARAARSQRDPAQGAPPASARAAEAGVGPMPHSAR